MMQPNWFDDEFDADRVTAGATLDEKATRALQEFIRSTRLHDVVKNTIDQHEKNTSRGIVGPSLSQAIRRAVADAVNAAP